jgi:decaprenyl-phosphate phosphoribosyltransferase
MGSDTAAAAVPAPRSRARAAVAALRPRQWTKNLLLFAGILFAAELGDADRWVHAVAIFVAYCAASSAAYLVNDVLDAADDRLHPIKSRRPIARGELSASQALVLAAVLAAIAIAIAATLGLTSLLLLKSFLVLQLLYSLVLKRVPLVDVLAIAGLFVIRAAAGAAAVDVLISTWLLVCTGVLALFLALAKRRGELALVGADRTPGRAVLGSYSRASLDRLLVAFAFVAAVVYALYTFNAHSRLMPLTIPFVVFGVVRYLALVRRRELGEEPEEILLTDRPIIGAVAAWAIVAAIVLATTVER